MAETGDPVTGGPGPVARDRWPGTGGPGPVALDGWPLTGTWLEPGRTARSPPLRMGPACTFCESVTT